MNLERFLASDPPDIEGVLRGKDTTKRIRLTIEWDGACSEADWARNLADMIEECDRSKITRVVDVDLLTNYGTTEKRRVEGIPPVTPFWRAAWGRVFRDRWGVA